MRISHAATAATLTILLALDQAQAATGDRNAAIAACMIKASATLDFSGTAYAHNGDVGVMRSFGTADGSTANTEQTRFNIGSADKMFVAIAIGMLVDRGIVTFDAPIARYLSGLDSDFANITVAELLDHTSGLGDYFRPENRAAIDAAKTATDLLPLALAKPPAFKPGSSRAYSNSGFIVLGAIIENVTGTTWSQFIQKEMLDPLGMADTKFDSLGGAVPMTRMSPAGQLPTPQPAPGPVLASPAGGMFSTPADISKLLSALFDGRLLSPSTRSILLTPRRDPAGGPITSGYGFMIREQPVSRIGIGGGAPGVNADIEYLPEAGWQLIALSNFDPPVASEMEQVLERTVAAPDVKEACDAALADPKLRKPAMIILGPSDATKPSR